MPASMKNLYYILILAIIGIGFSCGSREKFTGHIEIHFKKDAPNLIANKDIIKTRLERLEVKKFTIKDLPDGYAIELPRVADTLLLVNMMKFDDVLGFWETYEYVTVFQWLDKLNQLLVAEMPVDSTHDSIQIQQPLFAKLQMSVYKDNQGMPYLTEGSTIGLATINDTAEINQLLKKGYANFIFPQQMVLMWGEIQEQGTLPLYALKADEFTHGPFMQNGVVKTSRIKKNRNMGNTSLELLLTDEGGRMFATMTAKNIGKEIAISFGSTVIMHPKVENEIKDGRVEITGPDIERLQFLEYALRMPLYTSHPTRVSYHFALRK
jgi:SecD/SecF fusion protein